MDKFKLIHGNNTEKGIIFNIERFAIDDGPGIRTLVFFKGCNLHCSWCQNPESHKPKIEILFHKNVCSACGRCIEVCPQHAVYLDEKYGYLSDYTKCDGCGLCVKECYYSAREMVGCYYSVDELMAEIVKDLHFFEESGGGVTFSGGEPLLQAEFLKQVLIACRSAHIHTALETAGNISWEIIEPLIDFLDLVFIDYKQYDSDIHLKETGVPNKRIIETISRLNESDKEVIVRIPIIPGVNFTVEILQKMFGELTKYRNLKHIELLPFHALGKGKYQGLGMPYKFDEVKSLKKQDLESVRRIGSEMGLQVLIGSI